jgi:hypothetical protein
MSRKEGLQGDEFWMSYKDTAVNPTILGLPLEMKMDTGEKC